MHEVKSMYTPFDNLASTAFADKRHTKLQTTPVAMLTKMYWRLMHTKKLGLSDSDVSVEASRDLAGDLSGDSVRMIDRGERSDDEDNDTELPAFTWESGVFAASSIKTGVRKSKVAMSVKMDDAGSRWC
eukprot:TRINITY_DN94859_c0_g1_i1.p2 TRINITY_DN94859_c0_g1~~TRINITY_DN94859_c0_g1_i1.p2  ORF type:complete len:129 (+),score=18.60 TRINITY_DN94859_c0_g1_i1:871-1257(+)